MKYIIAILTVACLAFIIAGYVLDVDYAEKLIGIGVISLFVIVFPLFSYYRWKGKNVKDYMITNENLEKMRNHKG